LIYIIASLPFCKGGGKLMSAVAGYGGGYGSGFALVVVLFILLIIIGATVWGGY
jgi:uncharacterized protein (TIGR01732 family)